MPLATRAITHRVFGQNGAELAGAVVTAELSADEQDTANKHIRVNESPEITVTANASGVAVLNLPQNINESYYTIKTFSSGTSDFANTTPLHSVKIRVGTSDDDLVDLVI